MPRHRFGDLNHRIQAFPTARESTDLVVSYGEDGAVRLGTATSVVPPRNESPEGLPCAVTSPILRPTPGERPSIIGLYLITRRRSTRSRRSPVPHIDPEVRISYDGDQAQGVDHATG